MNGLTQSAARSGGGLPEDLSEWMDKTSLMSLTLDAVQEVSWSGVAGNFQYDSGQSFRPQMLLTLLVCGYAMGRYSSQEIEAAIEVDPALSYLCTGSPPDGRTLAKFRRTFRPEIEQVLTTVLRQAWELRFGAGATAQSESYLDASLDLWSGVPARPNFPVEARNRVEQAILLNSVARDF